jgi:hypothetical protein
MVFLLVTEFSAILQLVTAISSSSIAVLLTAVHYSKHSVLKVSSVLAIPLVMAFRGRHFSSSGLLNCPHKSVTAVLS